jgi:hypothetical protein
MWQDPYDVSHLIAGSQLWSPAKELQVLFCTFIGRFPTGTWMGTWFLTSVLCITSNNRHLTLLLHSTGGGLEPCRGASVNLRMAPHPGRHVSELTVHRTRSVLPGQTFNLSFHMCILSVLSGIPKKTLNKNLWANNLLRKCSQDSMGVWGLPHTKGRKPF